MCIHLPEQAIARVADKNTIPSKTSLTGTGFEFAEAGETEDAGVVSTADVGDAADDIMDD